MNLSIEIIANFILYFNLGVMHEDVLEGSKIESTFSHVFAT